MSIDSSSSTWSWSMSSSVSNSTGWIGHVFILPSSPPVTNVRFWNDIWVSGMENYMEPTSSSQSKERTTPTCPWVHSLWRHQGASGEEMFIFDSRATSPLCQTIRNWKLLRFKRESLTYWTLWIHSGLARKFVYCASLWDNLWPMYVDDAEPAIECQGWAIGQACRDVRMSIVTFEKKRGN